MENMDEMFVPYKTSLELPIPEPVSLNESSGGGSLLWIVIAITFVCLLVGAYVFVSSRIVVKEKAVEEPAVNEKKIEALLVPPTIDFSEPAKLDTAVMSKEELAKFIGTEIKNLLVLYSGVNSLQTASIVSFSVRTMLEDFAPVLQPLSVVPPSAPVMEKLDEEYISKNVLQPRPQQSQMSLEADEEEEVEPPKKGKINADTDPSLLLMLKQRGLVQN